MSEVVLRATAGISAAEADAGPPFDGRKDLFIEEAPVAFAGADGEELRGVIACPAGENVSAPQTALVTVHGWGTNRVGPARLLVRMARRAALNGAAALYFDLPGRGESAGEYASADIDAMINATLSAVRYMKGRGVQKVLLAGLCSGANIALAAGGLAPNDIAGVFAMSALPYQEERSAGLRLSRSLHQIKGYLKKALKFSTWKRLFKGEIDISGVAKTVSEDGRRNGDRNLKKSRRDLPEVVSRYAGAKQLMWGEKDPEGTGSRAYFERLFAGASKPADIYIVRGANHNYYGLQAQQGVLAVLDKFVFGAGETRPVE